MYEFDQDYKLGKPVVRDKHFVDNNSREEKTRSSSMYCEGSKDN
jgi:hypothetical protein